MVNININAQKWLDENYPKEVRNKRKKLIIDSAFYSQSPMVKEEIEAERGEMKNFLKLEGFVNLEELDCSNTNITSLDLSDCTNLKKLSCHSNLKLSELNIKKCSNLSWIRVRNSKLTDIDLSSLDPQKLTFLNLNLNNIAKRDLSMFNKFTNLKELYIANNNFFGSLSTLQNLEKLEVLNIAGNNIDSDLEYLPESIKGMFCNENNGEIYEELKNYRRNFESEELMLLYKIEYYYDYQAWRKDNKELVELVKKIHFVPGASTLINKMKKRIDKLQQENNTLKSIPNYPQLTSQIKNLEKEKQTLEDKCQELEKEIQKQKEFISNKVANKPINFGSVFLYSGDIIAIRTENGQYLKIVEDQRKTTIQTSNSNPSDDFSRFMVEIVEEGKVRLRVPNKALYYQIHDSQSLLSKKQAFVTFTENPNESNFFLVSRDNGKKLKVLLKATDDKYLNSRSLTFQDKEEGTGMFLVNKVNSENESMTNYREVVEDIEFHMENKKNERLIRSTPQELVQVNQGNESQHYTLTYAREYTRESTYNWGIELSVGVETKVKTGVPLIVEGEIALKLDGKVLGGSSHSHSVTETITGALEGTCPGHSKMVSKTILQVYSLEVPITTTISRYLVDNFGNERKYTYKIEGIFKGEYARVIVNHGESFPLREEEMGEQQQAQVELPPKGTQN